MAALAASRIGAAPVDLATDSRFVADGVAKLAAGASPSEWAHGDLWQHLVQPARSGHLRARWVPAHKTAAEYREQGRLEGDRLGNEAADASAGAAAAARAPPPSVLQAREQQVQDLGLAQK
eukprot:8326022-Heterocapsa_arctica.AAC.1